jgi:ABC-type multidrug transport system ATPase subunit
MNNNPIVVLMFYLIYGLDILSFSYLFSFLFKKTEDAVKWCGGFISLSITLVFILVKFIFKFKIPVFVNLILCLFPTYSFFYSMAVFGFAVMEDEPISIISLITFKGYGGQMAIILFLLIFQAILFTCTIAIWEYLRHLGRRPGGLFGKEDKLMLEIENQSNLENGEDESEEDEDVAYERQRILSGEPSTEDDILRIVDVHKVYKEKNKLKQAVNGVYLGVKKNSCLGLLGPNGAGKTSLINVISGVICANRGNVFINNFSIYTHANQAYASLGVCAQNDRLWEKLTVRDHLRIFSILRNVYSNDYIQQILQEFHLADVGNQVTKTLSGGEKRKLCVALAFIGSPSVIMLDEPSSGMDVATRRILWNKILSLKDKHAIVLTSHSMEEIDALCTNVCIMINGRLRCLGSSQHLKSKFSSGYRLVLSSEDPSKTKDWVFTTFIDAKLTNQVAHMQQFEIPKLKDVTLSFMFDQVEKMKQDLIITDYSISETTLEQVFLSLAKKQVD